ncbi:MAG: hypothetical protein M1823_004783 [Watsoniomyces obsoletus]|nr:MAG: hypothetical protein M1823_004783 [Watsoniomyces obsoletus]
METASSIHGPSIYDDHVSSAATTLHDAPTESHALAVADYDEKGVAEEDHDEPEVRDLGWHENVEELPHPLVAGLTNEDLWLLIRRFDKQMYHVKSIDYDPPGGLDLNIAKDEEFSPDKLRANIERLYMTVIVGMMGMVNHSVRLRSWRETRRTAAFTAAYFLAWTLDLLPSLIFATLFALIVYPPSRPILFPPAPIALVDSKTGGIQKPRAGMLGSHDSMTGAPERHKGEAVEMEAHNFVSGFASIGIGAATGKHPTNKAQEEGGIVDKSVPDPTSIEPRTVDTKHGTAGGKVASKHDKTKQPMEVAVWEKARPVMRGLADVADNWERMSKYDDPPLFHPLLHAHLLTFDFITSALSPTKPFKETARMRIGALLIPAIIGSYFIDDVMLVKSATFLTGFIFFGDPILKRGLDLLNYYVPNWPELLDPRNTILLGVPTNAQLTLTLLRIGEANKAPLPPPPRSGQPPPTHPPALHGDDVPLDASHEEIQSAIHPNAEAHQDAVTREQDPHKKPKHGRKLLAFFKGTTRAGVSTILGTDRLKASVGDEHAKMRLGVIPDPIDVAKSGPVDFRARYHGKKGHLYLLSSSSSTPLPKIFFSYESTWEKAVNGPVVFEVLIQDIKELKKIGGLGWKSKLVVGWALDRELADGLEVVDRLGKEYQLTAIPLRDELFNRLIAIGGQKWESW